MIESCNRKMTDHRSWIHLLTFSYVAFKSPDKSTSNISLATVIKRNLNFWNEIKNLPIEEYLGKIMPTSTKPKRTNKKSTPDSTRIKKAQSKLNEGDFKGAIRILSSDDTIAPFKVETYLKLLEKHPEPKMQLILKDPPQQTIAPVLEPEVTKAVFRFANGSGGGIDGLRPQHLKDMLFKENGEQANKLIRALRTFSEELLNGKAPPSVIYFTVRRYVHSIKMLQSDR